MGVEKKLMLGNSRNVRVVDYVESLLSASDLSPIEIEIGDFVARGVPDVEICKVFDISMRELVALRKRSDFRVYVASSLRKEYAYESDFVKERLRHFIESRDDAIGLRAIETWYKVANMFGQEQRVSVESRSMVLHGGASDFVHPEKYTRDSIEKMRDLGIAKEVVLDLVEDIYGS